MNPPRTCVSPEGRFKYGIHKPAFTVRNFRENDYIGALGRLADNTPCENRTNFPTGAVDAPAADTVYEIPNAFPFRGTTYINKAWADRNAENIAGIRLPTPPEVSFSSVLRQWHGGAAPSAEKRRRMLQALPEPLQLAIAEIGTDPEDLVCLAEICCEFVRDKQSGRPEGLRFHQGQKASCRPVIHQRTLFEVLANNPHLPDAYKEVMVLRPGVQGGSEIVGEFLDAGCAAHVFEYLRTNSYIPWGHYAANMAHDSIRYRVDDLGETDVIGMRRLYYQRTYTRLADDLGVDVSVHRRPFSDNELEGLRRRLCELMAVDSRRENLVFNRTLWGWNFGFDYAPSRYRLHASHQQVHQQFAMIPKEAETEDGSMTSYACGDQIESFISHYRQSTGTAFFDAYIRAIDGNRRMQGAPAGGNSLVICADDRVMVFVPKAQTSQWELQLMTRRPVGNILEADSGMRRSIDRAIYLAVRALGALGARMITAFEYSKRFDSKDADQRLIYTFLPRLPESPGAFSEAQLRWINGHYPEDFAEACRKSLESAGLQ